jgi:hypothetical protein
MTRLKLYSYDQGWAGGVVVAARSREEAVEKMVATGLLRDGAVASDKITEHKMSEDLVIEFAGDQ